MPSLYVGHFSERQRRGRGLREDEEGAAATGPRTGFAGQHGPAPQRRLFGFRAGRIG
jgi:hypothetical protein